MARYRKFVVALLGALVQIAQAGLLPVTTTWQPYVTAGIAMATALGVVAIPNAPAAKAPPLPKRRPGASVPQYHQSGSKLVPGADPKPERRPPHVNPTPPSLPPPGK